MTETTLERQRRAMAAFDAVVELAGEAREQRLRELSDRDPGLADELRAMLAADASAGQPFGGDAAAWGRALHERDADAPADGMLGRQLGAWRIVGAIGRGGMGTVYAVQRSDGAYAQQAALKLIRAAADSPAARERFLRERQWLAQLRHPNIATLLDGGFSDEGDPYFVMEFVDGAPIDQWCDARNLDLRQRVRLFLQVLDAVGHAHRNLVIHRDLKPSNLLVDGDGRVKLLDFGIAKQLEGGDATATSDRALTFEYASPEQLHDAPITTATDIWQLGIVLHRLLSGAHPFGLTSDTPLAKQLQLLEREPEPLTRAAAQASVEQAVLRGETDAATLAKSLRGGLAAIVETCLRREPEARYASADALAADLQRWREHRPVSAAQLGNGARAKLWLRRNRLLAASIGAVALALIGGTGVALWQANEARRESALSRESLQSLSDTLAAASPEQSLATQLSARKLLDKARAELDARNASDPRVKQPVQRMLGRLYHSLGDYAIAKTLLEAGLKDVAPTRREEALALADDLVVYSDVLDFNGEYDKSLAPAVRAVALRRRFAPGDARQELLALAPVSTGQMHKYGIPAAIEQETRALALAATQADAPVDVVMKIYANLSDLYALAGEYPPLLDTAAAGFAYADRHRLSSQSPFRLTLLSNKGSALMRSGREPEAVDVIRQAIASQQRTGSGAFKNADVLYNNLGLALQRVGRYRESAAALQRSNTLTDAGDNKPSPLQRAIGIANLAVVEAALGDAPGALSLARQTMRLLDEGKVPKDDMYRTRLERHLARILAADGQARSWLMPHLRASLERTRKQGGEGDEEHRLLLMQLLWIALDDEDSARGAALLKEARRVMGTEQPVDPQHVAAMSRIDAGFARLRGDLAAAERSQRQALDRYAAGNNTANTSIARAELAAIRFEREDANGARALLAQALPVLRDLLLPQETSRAEAEALARKLGIH